MWIVFALLSALLKGAGNVFNKMGADRVDSITLTWLVRLVGVVPWLLAILLSRDGFGDFTAEFIVAFVVVGSLNALMSMWRFDAFRMGEVSHLIPLGNFVPVVATIVAWVALNERPSPLGILGILVIVFGAYTLNVNAQHVHWLDPLRDLLQVPASRLYLTVMVLLGISVVIDRYGIDQSSVLTWGLAVVLMQAVILTPKALRKPKEIREALTKHTPLILGMALASFAAFFFQLLSFSAGGLVGLSLALKRLDSLVTIAIAGKFLNEGDTIKRLLSGATMAVGAIIIGVS